jgi:hypothetical protein
LRSKQIVFMFQVFQYRQQGIEYDTFKAIRDLVHFYFIYVFIFDFSHAKVLYFGRIRFALSDYMGVLRHGRTLVHV